MHQRSPWWEPLVIPSRLRGCYWRVQISLLAGSIAQLVGVAILWQMHSLHTANAVICMLLAPAPQLWMAAIWYSTGTGHVPLFGGLSVRMGFFPFVAVQALMGCGYALAAWRESEPDLQIAITSSLTYCLPAVAMLMTHLEASCRIPLQPSLVEKPRLSRGEVETGLPDRAGGGDWDQARSPVPPP